MLPWRLHTNESHSGDEWASRDHLRVSIDYPAQALLSGFLGGNCG